MQTPYLEPRFYDIAFDFRDVPAEVDFILEAAEKFLKKKARRALEFACGPAYHVREFARRGMIAHGVDLSQPMVDYANDLIRKENLNAKIFYGDMQTYRSIERYDIVLNLMCSFAHLLTNDAILEHLRTTADLLDDGGLYIIQTAHPRDFFQEEKSAQKPYWTMTRGETTVITSWGASQTIFDPMTEIDDVTVTYTVTENEQSTEYSSPVRLRRLSLQTFRALVAQCGRFDIVALVGDMDLNVPLDSSSDSHWLIPILQKRK